jgi:arylamine N-acetyltransferase
LAIPVDDILEDLELARAEPGPGYLERLFLRFNERVPFETASKIRRHARVSDAAAKPRTPDVFWRERLEEGAGGTFFPRVAGFHALLAALGFDVRLALGKVERDGDHAALFVRAGGPPGAEWICDVGFPLPALLPARAGRVETGMGPVAVTATPRGFEAVIEEGVPDGPRRLEVFAAEVAPEEFARTWEATFRPTSKFLTAVALRKQLEARAVSFARGALRVDDRHSRTTVPLAAPRSGILEETFGVSADLLEEAFAIAGDPDPASPDAEVAVYLETSSPADAAWSAIASPSGYAALYEGVAEAATDTAAPRAWRTKLEIAGGATVVDEVTADEAARIVTVSRESPASRTSWAVQEKDGVVYLVRRQTLVGPRHDLLRNDSLRGRLAGTLAVDLLGWARLLDRAESG